jgi:hypothetical protein
MSDELLYPPVHVNARCVIPEPGPRFWPEEIIELAKRRDRDADLIVADWLEEQQCRRAAACFRSSAHRLWRSVITIVAELTPEAAPRGSFLEHLALLVVQFRTQEEYARTLLGSMSPDDTLGITLAGMFPEPVAALPMGED